MNEQQNGEKGAARTRKAWCRTFKDKPPPHLVPERPCEHAKLLVRLLVLGVKKPLCPFKALGSNPMCHRRTFEQIPETVLFKLRHAELVAVNPFSIVDNKSLKMCAQKKKLTQSRIGKKERVNETHLMNANGTPMTHKQIPTDDSATIV